MSIVKDFINNSAELKSDTVATDTEVGLKLDKAGGTITGDLTINANLYVNGTETIVDTTTVETADNLILIVAQLLILV